ncbi:MAG: glycosyltransferase [Bacteroidales bacterium]|nr:glycosyltransferase [Bacteroidales bacterium]
MKLCIIEANMTGLQHVPINSSIINMIISLYSYFDIELHCSQEHYENLNINKNAVEFIPIQVLQPGSKRIQKFFLEYYQTKRIINEQHADLFILLSCYPNVQYFLTKYLKKRTDKKILMITHGEMEGLRMSGKWKIWSYPFWVYLCSKIAPSKNLNRLVLGENIAQNMKKYKNFQNVFFLNHPLQISDTEFVLPKANDNVFGYVGSLLKNKGVDVLIKAANTINKNSKSYFEIIGSHNLENFINTDKLHSYCSNGEMLSKQKYNDLLKKITYACFPFPADSYKFTASGAVLDAISFLKPIIYIRNDYFDCLFKDAGDIGFRCKDGNDFVKCILELDEKMDENKYKQQIANLEKLREKLTIKNIQNDLHCILKSLI